MEDSKESFGSGTDLSKISSFEKALASSTFSPTSKQVSVFSEFSDSDCGEPLEPHHIFLDFTPTDDDDDFSQRKCCEFWKYINSRRDLQGMMVRPEAPTSRPDTDVNSVTPYTTERNTARPKTAVSMLQIVEEKGLIDRAFEVKMQQSRCTLGSHEYELGAGLKKTKCPCPGPCWKCPNMTTSDAQALCEQLHSWDINHPKSMDPPCHPPSSVGSLTDQTFGMKAQQSRGSLRSHEKYEMKTKEKANEPIVKRIPKSVLAPLLAWHVRTCLPLMPEYLLWFGTSTIQVQYNYGTTSAIKANAKNIWHRLQKMKKFYKKF